MHAPKLLPARLRNVFHEHHALLGNVLIFFIDLNLFLLCLPNQLSIRALLVVAFDINVFDEDEDDESANEEDCSTDTVEDDFLTVLGQVVVAVEGEESDDLTDLLSDLLKG